MVYMIRNYHHVSIFTVGTWQTLAFRTKYWASTKSKSIHIGLHWVRQRSIRVYVMFRGKTLTESSKVSALQYSWICTAVRMFFVYLQCIDLLSQYMADILMIYARDNDREARGTASLNLSHFHPWCESPTADCVWEFSGLNMSLYLAVYVACLINRLHKCIQNIGWCALCRLQISRKRRAVNLFYNHVSRLCSV